MVWKQCKYRVFYVKIIRKYGCLFMRNVFYFSKKVRLFSQNDVLFLFLFFDKSGWDHCLRKKYMLVVCESKCFHSLKRKGLQERSENKIPLACIRRLSFLSRLWNLLLKSLLFTVDSFWTVHQCIPMASNRKWA